MNSRHVQLEDRIRTLLADPQNASSPMGQVLDETWQVLAACIQRLERLTSLSDSYQAGALERERGQASKLERQLRRASRIARLSDKYQGLLREVNTHLADSSNRDPLTNIPNRRALVERLRQAGARAARGEGSFVAAMIDIDFFKQVNDQHGHDAGDRLLVATAQTLCMGLRAQDICGRWGGEEFLMLLEGVDLATGLHVLKRKLGEVAELRLPSEHGEISLTMSAGITLHIAGEPVTTTVERADAALYTAKHQGRNRIICH